MSPQSLTTTIEWMYTAITFYVILSVVVFILLVIELRTLYWDVCEHFQQNAATLAVTQRVRNASDGSGSSENPSHSAPQISTDIATTSVAKKKAPRIWCLKILPIFMYIFFILTGIVGVFFKLGIGGFSHCTPCGIQGICYALGKMMLYHTLIYRIYAVYSKSIFQYNTRILTAMAIICAIYINFASIYNIFTVTSVSITIDNHTFCGCASNPVPFLMVIISDSIMSVLCCYLFIRPLKAINMLQDGGKDPELSASLVKYTILTFVTVISTFLILIVIIVTKLNALLVPDAVINCICIFLFNNTYDKAFKVLCCGVHKRGTKVVDLCCSRK